MSKFKLFFFYLFNDPYWLFRPITKIFYDLISEKKYKKIFYKKKLNKILKIEITENDKDLWVKSPDSIKRFSPEIVDLGRLYNEIDKFKPFTILEFGVGYSTIVMAEAMHQNYINFDKNKISDIRNSKLFKIFSVDSSERWIEETKKNIPEHLKNYIELSYSDVYVSEFNGQMCHFYKSIPDINPDFIYLDGPHPTHPIGNLNNLTFDNCIERTPISADICKMESTLLPGLRILVDGRTNNVRFLKNNLRRNFKFYWDRNGDVTRIVLKEKKLGKINKLGFEYYN